MTTRQENARWWFARMRQAMESGVPSEPQPNGARQLKAQTQHEVSTKDHFQSPRTSWIENSQPTGDRD